LSQSGNALAFVERRVAPKATNQKRPGKKGIGNVSIQERFARLDALDQQAVMANTNDLQTLDWCITQCEARAERRLSDRAAAVAALGARS
jgi:hypothetical protein